MKSKRAALWLALGGLVGLGSLNGVSAADRFVADASYQGGMPTSQSEVVPVGHFDASCDESCDTFPEMECGCGALACDGGCGDMGCGEMGGGLFGDGGCGLFECDLGDPFTLFGEACGYSVGGWVQMGYHNKALPLFNNRPDEYNLHQAWFYAEKAIDTSNGFDFGGRIDYVYGVDAQDTQAFGIDNGHWDTGWDHGQYGSALPQVYGEVGYGDFSVKFGHFFTIIGYEVVAAPDNFFYSHAYTMYNSEPFTHTGALATYNAGDDLTLYGGYTLGWDSGFEDNGDSFLGGASLAMSDDVTVTYATVAGRFADQPGGTTSQGYMHSIVTDVTLTDQLQYVLQSDYIDAEDGNGANFKETYGLNNYLIYTVSDCLALGSRFEWYDADAGVFNGNVDVYALTLGANVKPHANVLIRPEIRWDWADGADVTGILENDEDEQTTFGIDTIFLF
jgi:hypothetical protein